MVAHAETPARLLLIERRARIMRMKNGALLTDDKPIWGGRIETHIGVAGGGGGGALTRERHFPASGTTTMFNTGAKQLKARA